MADAISSLKVIFDATVAPLVNGIRGPVIGALNTFKSAVGEAVSSLTTLTGFSAGLAAVGGAAGLGFLLKSQMEAIESSTRLADRLGLTTEALTTFQFAARQAGIDSETFAKGTSTLWKSIGKGSKFGGELAKEFAAIGLNVNELSGMKPEEAVGRVADALKGLKNPYEAAAAATALMGRQVGQEMLPFLLEGSAALQAARKDADALGLSYNRVDAEKVVRAQQSLGRVVGVFQGFARQVGIILSPYIEQMNNSFVQFGVKAIAAVKTYLPKVIDYIRLTWARIIASYEFIKPYVVAVWRYVADVTMQIWQKIYNFVAPYITSIRTWIEENWTKIVETTIGLGLAVYNVISESFLVAWEVIKVVAGGITAAWKVAMDYLFGSTISAGLSIGKAIQTIAEWANWLAKKITIGLNVAAYAIAHLKDTWELLSAGVQYYAVMIASQLKWAFTEVPRAVLAWFQTNWRAVFSDIYTFTTTVFANIGSNIASFATALKSFFSGDGFNFQWTGLTKGFANTLQQLPQIAERQVGPLEQGLKDKFGKLAEGYKAGLSGYLDEQAKKTGDLTDKVKSAVDWIKDQFSKPSTIKIDPIKPPEIPTPQFDIDELPAIQAIDKVKHHAQKLDLIKAHSAEALKLRAEAFAASIAQEQDSGAAGAGAGKPRSPVPQPAPVPPRAAQGARAEADRDTTLKQIADLLQKFQPLLQTMAKNSDEQDVIYAGA
jgi:phage-related protein